MPAQTYPLAQALAAASQPRPPYVLAVLNGAVVHIEGVPPGAREIAALVAPLQGRAAADGTPALYCWHAGALVLFLADRVPDYIDARAIGAHAPGTKYPELWSLAPGACVAFAVPEFPPGPDRELRALRWRGKIRRAAARIGARRGVVFRCADTPAAVEVHASEPTGALQPARRGRYAALYDARPGDSVAVPLHSPEDAAAVRIAAYRIGRITGRRFACRLQPGRAAMIVRCLDCGPTVPAEAADLFE